MKLAIFEGCPGEDFFAEVIGGVAVVIECVPEREQIPDVIDESGGQSDNRSRGPRPGRGWRFWPGAGSFGRGRTIGRCGRSSSLKVRPPGVAFAEAGGGPCPAGEGDVCRRVGVAVQNGVVDTGNESEVVGFL